MFNYKPYIDTRIEEISEHKILANYYKKKYEEELSKLKSIRRTLVNTPKTVRTRTKND